MMDQYFQQQTQIMPEPPSVISSKDHLYLKDALSWELTAMKMLHHGANNCADPEIKDYLNRSGQMHQKHYQILLKHISPGNVTNQ